MKENRRRVTSRTVGQSLERQEESHEQDSRTAIRRTGRESRGGQEEVVYMARGKSQEGLEESYEEAGGEAKEGQEESRDEGRGKSREVMNI